MRRLRLSVLVFLLLAPAGELAAELVPLGPEVALASGALFPVPRVAAQPTGNYAVAVGGDCEPQQLIVVYRGLAAGGAPMTLRRRPQPVVGRHLGGPGVDSLTATSTGFDLLWHACEETRNVVFRGELDASGKVVGRSTRLGSADWVWRLGNGELLIGWARPQLSAIEARRLTASGSPVGPVLQLNSRPVDRAFPAVVSAADGGFVALWQALVPRTNDNWVLRARRFSAAGEPLGPDFDVHSLAGEPQGLCCWDKAFAVAAAPDGGLAVSWVLDSTLYVRFFDSLAVPLGPEVPITTGNVMRPSSMAFDSTGNVLLAWELISVTDLRLQLLDGSGVPLGSPIRVSPLSLDVLQPFTADVAWAGDSWLVAWNAFLFPFDVGAAFVRRFADAPRSPAGD